ncbi:MAG: excinuclease ABC subunit UvrA, partial [Verrucomicrobiota bacterium]
VGVPHDPETGEALSRSTTGDIIAEIIALPEKTKLMILAPIECGEGESFAELADRLKKQGFLRLRLDGEIVELDQQLPDLAPNEIEIVVDRIVIREDIRSRVADSVETALRMSGTKVIALIQDENREWQPKMFVTTFTNPATGFTLPELTPKHFSFNSHFGACPECHGLGSCLEPDPMLFVPDPDKSVNDGGVKSWWSGSKKKKGAMDRLILALVAHFEEDPDVPVRSMSREFKRAMFHGTKEPVAGPWATKPKPFEGLFPHARRLLQESKSEITKRNVRRFMSMRDCKSCEGKRLKPSILAVTLSHEKEARSIEGFTSLSIERALEWIDGITLTDTQQQFAPEVIREVRKRLEFLIEVGLGYLTLDRESGSLSGGESQRIRLATQLGAGLAGVLYVLDEPSIGLHQADNEKLIGTLKRLRDLGNSIIVVEHDEDTIREADHVIDIGPAAGEGGGQILAQGTPDEVCGSAGSVTGKYLTGDETIELPERRFEPPKTSAAAGGLDSGWLVIKNANEHNLQNVDAAFPLGCLVCVTGPSGSGKSTLIDKILRRALFRKFYQSKDAPGEHDEIIGLDQIDKAIVIDQTPIGRSPRSNPATYANVFSPIRDLFAELPLSRQRGYEAGRFSFNVDGGRCEACQGDGMIKIDMHFLSDVYVTCETCRGRRYNEETLQVVYRGQSIADVLEMSIDEARRFFQKIPKVHSRLKALCDVGLGYLRMGQSATTLSGGEAQRVKL